MGRLAEHPTAGQDLGVGLAGVDHRLQLSVRDQPVRADLGRQDRAIGRGRRGHRGHRAGFHEGGGVRDRLGQGDAAEPIGLIEAHVVALARPVLGLVGDLGGLGEQGKTAGRRSQLPGPGDQKGGMVYRPELPGLGGQSGLDAHCGCGRIDQGQGVYNRRQGRIGCTAIDHHEARLHGRAVLGVSPLGEAQQESNPAARRQGAHRRRILEQPGGDDRRHAPPIGQRVQGRVQVRLQFLERRVEHHGVETAGGRQDVGQVGRVVP